MNNLIIFLVLIASHAYGREADFEINIDELAKSDKTITKETEAICKEIGSDSCEAFMKPCETAPLPNTCFQRNFLFYLIDIELCGNEKSADCRRERIYYWDKISTSSEMHANQPGLGRAALNFCQSFFIVKPKSEKLQEIQNSLNKVIPDMGTYTENKKYYECIKENYLKRAIP